MGEVNQDFQLAKEWYEKAIQMADDPKAYLGLGNMSFCGRGVPQDYGEAYYYFSQLVNEEEAGAFFALGYMNEFGLGVSKNLGMALEFYEKAIFYDHILAITRSGLVYFKLHRYKHGLKQYLIGSIRGILAVLKNSNDRRMKIK